MHYRPLLRPAVLGIGALATIGLLTGCGDPTTGTAASGAAQSAASSAAPSETTAASAAPAGTETPSAEPTVVPSVDVAALPAPDVTVDAEKSAGSDTPEQVLKYGQESQANWNDHVLRTSVKWDNPTDPNLYPGVFEVTMVNAGTDSIDLSKAKLTIHSSDGTLLKDVSERLTELDSTFAAGSQMFVPVVSMVDDPNPQVWLQEEPGVTGIVAWSADGN